MQKIKINNTDEIVYSFKTSTNLPVYMWVNEKKENAYLALVVKYGSSSIEFKCNNNLFTVPTGTAHFLEHIKFHLKNGDVTEQFLDLGCDSNAYTSTKETAYEVYANENVYEAAKVLLNFVQDDYFTKKMISDEKGIILEEANSKKDNPNYEFYTKYLENLLTKSNNRFPVIGLDEDIKKISLEDVKLVHDYFYRPENMFMVVTGNFDPEEMKRIICENESNRNYKSIGNIKVVSKNETSKLNKTYYEVSSKNCVNTQSKYTIKESLDKFKGYTKEEVLVALRSIFNANFGMTSDFNEQLIQESLITNLMINITCDDNALSIDISYQSENVDEVLDLIKNKLKNMTINKEELNRIIHSSESQLIMKFDNIYGVADSFISSLIERNKIDADFMGILKSMTLKKILDIYKLIDINNAMLGVLKPQKK